MKLILLLLALYSLIFYQHYKIQKSKASLPETESKAVMSSQEPGLTDQQEYRAANFLIGGAYSNIPKQQIAKAGLYQ